MMRSPMRMNRDRGNLGRTAGRTRFLGAGVRGARWTRLCISFSICGFVAACGSGAAPQSEDYGNLLASPAGLVLLEEEHPTGWTRPDCFGCHNVNNIHQVNRTGLSDDTVDLPGVRAIVESGGESSCTMCHGDNGVQP